MTRKYLLAALLLASLGMAQSKAQDQTETTMEEYTKHLIDVYGDKGVIIAGTINGKTAGGNYVNDFFPSPDPTTRFFNTPIKTLSLTISEAQCAVSQVITRPTSGAYAFPWCAKYETIGGTSFEAKRDTLYYAGGSWTYVVSSRFNCQNSSDLAQMPLSVKTAVCN